MVRLSRLLIYLILLAGSGESFGQVVADLPRDLDSILTRAELLLGQAPRTVDIVTFELKADNVGLTFLAGLVDAARRGARVRLIVDNKFQDNMPGLFEFLQQNRIQVRLHNPIEFTLRDFFQPIQAFHRVNRRMHDKMFLVNGEWAVIGDKNYKGKFFWHSLQQAQEGERTMLGKEFVLRGANEVGQLSRYFDEIWREAPLVEGRGDGALTSAQQARFRADFAARVAWAREQLARRPERAISQREFHNVQNFEVLHDTVERQPDGTERRSSTLDKILHALRSAPEGSRVMIENSYFVLFHELEDVLRNLRRRNVEVHVVLNAPEVSDQRIIAEALRLDLPRMLELGLKVYLNVNERRTSHAKLVVINDTVINGSTNIDPRSMHINSEVSVKMGSPGLAAHLWSRFQQEAPLRRRVYEHRSCRGIFVPGYHLTPQSPLSPGRLVDFIRPQL